MQYGYLPLGLLPHLCLLANLDACKYVAWVTGGEAGGQQEHLSMAIRRDRLERADTQIQHILQGCVAANSS